MVQPPKDLRTFESLLEVVKALRGPDGCPWDKEQTHRSLTPYAIEEAFELAEAIESGDHPEMVAELGDLLLQVALHSEIGRQEGRFDVHDVLYAINEKMVRRHPHVFGDARVGDSAEVLQNWAELKKQEKAAKAAAAQGAKPNGAPAPAEAPKRFDVPLDLPALMRAHKIGAKTKAHRFDWGKPEEVMVKVEEEIGEMKEAINGGDKRRIEAELGDLLFSVAQLARHLGVEPEQALRTTNQRFEKRFFHMQELVRADGKDPQAVSTDELEAYWQKAKAALKGEESGD